MRRAIIVDLDGTLCNNSHRVMYVDGSQPKDWDKFNTLCAFDPHNDWCLDLVNSFNLLGHKIVFLTARSGSEVTKKMTDTWLMTHVGPGVDYELLMRKDGDFRPDYVVKQEIYMNDIAPRYEIVLAVDDKKRVCDMWRDLGIAALHCEGY